MIKIIVFDFDGVLVDSLPVKDNAYYKLFLPYGEQQARQALEYHVTHRGMFRIDKIHAICEEVIGLSVSHDTIKRLEQDFRGMIIDQTISAPPIKGAMEFIKSSSLQKCYIVSAVPQEEIRYIVNRRGLSSFFKNVYGGPEKKSSIIKSILQNEKSSPLELLFIGDAFTDYLAARENNAQFLGIVVNQSENPFPKDIPVERDLTCLTEVIGEIKSSQP